MDQEKVMTLLQFFVVVLLCPGFARGQNNAAPSTCRTCLDTQTCTPPNCYCCRDELQLPMTVSDIPQIVFFTFDDALTDQVAGFYDQLFDTSRKNPNGCPISMTMFISHNNTKYNQVNKFYRKGMEIAAHSVTHHHMNEKNFFTEAKLQKNNLARLGGIPERHIVGWRSPFLEPVGDLQPDKLKELGYLYDSTLTFSKRKLSNKAPTPFTLDFGWPYTCQVKPCPTREHSGFWEVPIVSLIDYKHKYDCVYVDGCMNAPPDEDSAYKFLMDNFNSYHTKSRVPFGINMHASWFFYPDRLKAMDRFIKELTNRKDVYILSIKQMIAWLKNPVALSHSHSFKPWSCSRVTSTGSSFQSMTSSQVLPAPTVRKVNPLHMQKLQSWQQKFTESKRQKPIRKVTFRPRGSRLSNWRSNINLKNGILRIPANGRTWTQRRQNRFRKQNRPRKVLAPTISSIINFNPAQNTVIRQNDVLNTNRQTWVNDNNNNNNNIIKPFWQRGTSSNQVTHTNSADKTSWWAQQQSTVPQSQQIRVVVSKVPIATSTPNQRNALSFEQQQLQIIKQQEQQHLLQQQQHRQLLRQQELERQKQIEKQRLAEEKRLQQEQERQRQIQLEMERKEQLALQESLRKEAARRERLREERLLKQQKERLQKIQLQQQNQQNQRQQQQQQQQQQNRQSSQSNNRVSSTRRAIEIWQRFVKFLTGKM